MLYTLRTATRDSEGNCFQCKFIRAHNEYQQGRWPFLFKMSFRVYRYSDWRRKTEKEIWILPFAYEFNIHTSNKSKGQWYWLYCLWPRLTLSKILHLIRFLHGIDHDSYEACYWDSLLPIPPCLEHSQLTRMCSCSSAIFFFTFYSFFFFIFFFYLRQLHTQLAEVYDDTCGRGLAWLANMWWQLGHKVI